jgi:Flp pilus assembly protein TadD
MNDMMFGSSLVLSANLIAAISQLLLKMAARKGNATAIYNVGVLFENRGEMDKANIAYETARKLQGK